MNDIVEMTNPDVLVNDVAESEDPLRTLCLLLAADMLEMSCEMFCSGGSPGSIQERLETVMAALEKRFIVEPILINWVKHEPAIH
jgi:hypothetical protein